MASERALRGRWRSIGVQNTATEVWTRLAERSGFVRPLLTLAYFPRARRFVTWSSDGIHSRAR